MGMVRVQSLIIALSLALASLWFVPIAAAQDKDAGTTVSSVVVTAPRSPKVVQARSGAFVQSYAAVPNPEIGQIGRWHDPVCVQVIGLAQADQAAIIKARIEGVAWAVGLPAARAGCRANVEIVFTSEPQRVMDVVALRREYLLGYDHLSERDRLKAVTRPIQAWYVTATRGEGTGSAVMALTAGLGKYSPSQVDVIDDPHIQPPNGCADSRIATTCLQSSLHNVFVVADSKALEGKDLGLVADYMVMPVLSQPRTLDGCGALPSVLDLFAKPDCADRDAPDGLTPADAAYLTALYTADLRARKGGEQTDVAARMARILIKAQGAGR